MSTNNVINRKSDSLTLDPGASGDSYCQFNINGTGEFRIGVDDTDSDAFKISQGSALGTTDTLVMSAVGEQTMPLQPSFGTTASTQNNVTGDGTVYTVVFSTERFDQNNDYDGTSTFTAPVDGIYQFNADVYLLNLTVGQTSAYIQLVTTARTYTFGYVNGYAASQYQYHCGMHLSVLADMTAADTAVVTAMVSGGAKVNEVNGSNTFFNGYLAC